MSIRLFAHTYCQFGSNSGILHLVGYRYKKIVNPQRGSEFSPTEHESMFPLISNFIFIKNNNHLSILLMLIESNQTSASDFLSSSISTKRFPNLN